VLAEGRQFDLVEHPLVVAASTTGGATPAALASSHRGRQRHHRSPGSSPGNPRSGRGVTRSFPCALENDRNSSVTTAHTS
jgi:hypothetical protein